MLYQSVFAKSNFFDPLHPTLTQVLDFLTFLFQKGLKYSSINTDRAALSTFVSYSNLNMGEEPLIKKFMKGVFNERPALPRYQSSWSVDKVLNYLSGKPSVSEMSLKELTFKLVMLLAVITGQRCQTLPLLDLKDLHVTGDGVKFVINSLVKQSRLGCTQPILNLISYPHNIKLCIVSVLREYLVRTRSSVVSCL